MHGRRGIPWEITVYSFFSWNRCIQARSAFADNTKTYFAEFNVPSLLRRKEDFVRWLRPSHCFGDTTALYLTLLIIETGNVGIRTSRYPLILQLTCAPTCRKSSLKVLSIVVLQTQLSLHSELTRKSRSFTISSHQGFFCTTIQEK